MDNFKGLRYKREESSINNIEDLKAVIRMYAGRCPNCKALLDIQDIDNKTFFVECECGFKKTLEIECSNK